MAIADRLQSIEQHLTNAYNAVTQQTGTITGDKNLQNLQSCILTIPVASPTTINLQVMEVLDLQNIAYNGGEGFDNQYYIDILPVIYKFIDTIMGNEEE